MPSSTISNWLTLRGLLTQRLRQACQSGFAVEVLAEGHAGTLVPTPTVRRVVLWCGDAACVYAETHAQQHTLRSNPWLLELGSDPLGESLHNRTAAKRTDFEFARVDQCLLPLDVAPLVDRTCWARRSEFVFPGGRVTVAEVFLAGIAAISAVPDP